MLHMMTFPDSERQKTKTTAWTYLIGYLAHED